MKFLTSQISYFLNERAARQNIRALLKYVAFTTTVIAVYFVVFHLIMLHAEGRYHSWVTGIYWTLTDHSRIRRHHLYERHRPLIQHHRTNFRHRAAANLAAVHVHPAFLCYVARGANPAHGATRAAGKYQGPRDHLHLRHDRPRTDREIAPSGHPVLRHRTGLCGSGAHARRRPLGITGEIDSPATYQKLRVAQARLVFANSSDTVNTNIILTVREAALKVPVVGMVENEDSIDILQLSGCDHVLALHQKLAARLAGRVNAGHAQSHVIGNIRDLRVADSRCTIRPLSAGPSPIAASKKRPA